MKRPYNHKLAIAKKVNDLFHRYGLLDDLASLVGTFEYAIEEDFYRKLTMKLDLIEKRVPMAGTHLRKLRSDIMNQ